MSRSTLGSYVLAIPLMICLACADADPGARLPTPAEPAADAVAEAVATPADTWWASWQALCGQAFAGRMVSDDEVDADFGAQPMVMHIRRCTDDRIEVPFHVGEDRSRTWILSRSADGFQLQHDHRHADGSADVVTFYGGSTVAGNGTATSQDFPADDTSKALFEANDLNASVANTWTLEILPGERAAYSMRRPERHFRVEFDLTVSVDPPPAPWGHEAASPVEGDASTDDAGG